MKDIISQVIENCELYPEQIAVKYQNTHISYRELEIKSRAFSLYLQHQGLQKGDHVGVILGRGIELIITILSILRLGAVYVPIDPKNPIERMTYIINDSKPKALVIDQLGDGIIFPNNVLIINTSYLIQQREVDESKLLTVIIDGDDPAYIIYTSGTTGQAKGVVVSHDNLLSLFEATSDSRMFDFNKHDTWSLFSSYAFDFSIWEIFGALIHAAKLVIVPPALTTNPPDFYQFLLDEQVTILNNTPSSFYRLIDVATNDYGKPVLRYVIFGGEALNFMALTPWFDKFNTIKMINMYGITETTIHTTFHLLTAEDIKQSKSIIGRSLANATIYLLDGNKQHVKTGEVGELYISGRGVAIGYFNKKEITAQSFLSQVQVADTIINRLYRSGDLGRLDVNGNIEYIGRANNQVKILGYRIECGEVEAALNCFPAIQQSYVCKQDFNSHDSRLVAFVLPNKLSGRNVRSLISLKRTAEQIGIKYKLLPNNLPLFYINADEKNYMYEEIFLQQIYLKNGIVIEDGDTILDIGANIGMFCVFASAIAENLKIYAFEPIKKIYDVLESNAKLYSESIKTFQVGVSDSIKNAELTYLPEVSVMSSMYSNRDYSKSLLKNTLSHHIDRLIEFESSQDEIDKYIEEKLKTETIIIQLTTLAEIIEQNKLTKIDLLKIDVEQSELDVLNGLREQDWLIIKQIVIEVHTEQRQEAVISLLQKHHFEVIVEANGELLNTDIVNIYARSMNHHFLPKVLATKPVSNQSFYTEDSLITALKNHCDQILMPYMIPSHIILVDEMPTTLNGKLDVAAMTSKYKLNSIANSDKWTATQLKLLIIFQQLLSLESLNLHDKFNDNGGHSLLIFQLLIEIKKVFGVLLTPAEAKEASIISLSEIIDSKIYNASNYVTT